MTEITNSYTYKRFTPRGKLHELTDPEHMELAQRILGDQVFCAQITSGVLRRLRSDDPNTVYEALGSVYKFEDKIHHLGGWDKFLASKEPVAEKDPLQDDHHAVGVRAPQRRRSFLEQERASQHDATFTEARELAEEHANTGVLTNRILRGLRSTKIRDVRSSLTKAKETITQKELTDANPLHFLHEEAQSLGRDLIDVAFHLNMVERTSYMQLYVELTTSWMEKELLELWILEAKVKLNPPEENHPTLPMAPASMDDEALREAVARIEEPGKGEMGQRPILTDDKPQRGQTVPKTQKQRQKGQKGGSRHGKGPGRTGKKAAAV